MPNTFGGNYDQTKPWAGPGEPVVAPTSAEKNWSYAGPWASNEERLTQQALLAATLSADDVARLVRPNLPQLRLFPDRFGFGERTQPDIDDVVSVDRAYNEPRVAWFSGSPAGYSGSSRNSLEGV